ncbi:hypothetical protein KUCAC02_018091 [Chaenocephalus aceratus]|uniref:Uncharacterized protein n=1 Tax=Chaenocephalus aceratus TaxID=36190 RepID=A0ACB9W858_CHAAC|nr:hypothetical protein KUCAC02_018091 [Chaenocephalus aceratus]
MLGGIFKDVLVTVTLLFLTQTWTQCRAKVDLSLVTLPDWRENAEYGTQCSYDGHNNPMCDWTQLRTVCPINCDFENNLCGWEQLMQDSFDWTRHSGPTPSNLTGPNQDHTTGAGFYMYIEGSSVTHGDSACLRSSMCHYDGPLWLNFWYHMYGSANAMALNIYLLKDNKPTKLWSIMNNQGPEWHLGHVYIRVSGPFQILLEGIRGSDAQSDVAIDDISINFGSCLGSVPGLVSGTVFPSSDVEVLPSHPVCNLDCSFDSSLCSWSHVITGAFDLTWQRGSTPTLMTGPSADHTGDGRYLYIEASSVMYGDTARLISSECSDSGPQCLQFWYHMHGSADTMGLHVYLLQDRQTEVVLWKTNDQGYIWQMAQVDIRTTRAFKIIIEGRRGSNEKSDLAIDDVKLYRGRCSDLSDEKSTSPSKPDGSPVVAATTDFNKDNVAQAPNNRHPVCQLNCNYEQDLCQWTQLYTDVIDWTRHSGSTPTIMTGPSSDHTTGGGHYLYIEANSASHGDTAGLISSKCSDSGPQCLQFWYHMYGSADTMGLHVYLLQDILADAVWWKRNYHGNMWHLAQVDLATYGAFQVIFEGRIGSNDQSDVAIDDVSLHRGHCRDLAQPTTPATTATPKPSQTTVKPQLQQYHNLQQPTTTNKPHSTTAPSCPENSHYTTCVPACSPTCTHLNGPPRCTEDEGCVQGCVCDEGFVQKNRVCVPIEQCGCVERNGNKYDFSDVWYTRHCSQKCECEKDRGVGRIDCDDKDECDGKAVCLQNDEGNYYCQSTGFSECTIREDPEYTSFDKMKHKFKGDHSYVLVQTKNLPNNLPHVYIEGINTVKYEDDSHQDDDSGSEEDHSPRVIKLERKENYSLQELKIRVYNHTVVLKKNMRLVVDGRRTEIPASPTAGLKIRELCSRISLKTDFGLSVDFDGHGRAGIILPRIYKKKVGGLCGNFDGNKKNDMMKPDGTRAKNVQEFGESWRV